MYFKALTLTLAFAIHITTLTTSRTFRSPLRSSQFRAFSTQRNPPRSAQSRNGGSEKSRVATHLKDLLQGHRAEYPTNTSKAKANNSEPLQSAAVILPDIKYYQHDAPHDRWRQRLSLGTYSRDDSKIDQRPAKSLTGWGSTILYKQHHTKLLGQPDLDINKAQRRWDYTPAFPMRSYLQFISTPTADTPGTSLLLHFDNKRYLIGSLAEGTQRASAQTGTRLLKVSECFVTGRTEWRNTGGVMGMILTLAGALESSRASSLEEAKKKALAKGTRLGYAEGDTQMKQLVADMTKDLTVAQQLNFFAPPNLNQKLATARRFIFRKGMPVNVHEIRAESKHPSSHDEWEPYWADQNLKVWVMPILPSDGVEGQATLNQTRSTSPRKRSIDELDDNEPSPTSNPPRRQKMIVSEDLPSEDHYQLTVKAVVGEMFNSSWRLDTLHETRLADVNMPASIFIRDSQTHKVDKYHGPLPGGPKPLPDPDLTVLVRKPWPGALIDSLPPTKPVKEAISYIFRNHTQRGKFDPEKAKALKVEKGRKWATLTAGESVQNEDGETITPDQVLGESKPGGGFAVVDLPDPSYVENLLARPEWEEAKIIDGVGVVVWICGKNVANDARLHTVMQSMTRVKHIVSSPDYCPNDIAMDAAAVATIRLNQIDAKRYNVPVHGTDGILGSGDVAPLPEGVLTAERGQIVQLAPTLEVQNNFVLKPIDIPACKTGVSQAIIKESENVQRALSADKSIIDEWASTLPCKDAEIITLGTGSALPSLHRNVSATLLRVPGWGNLLFDCGENTIGQLRRVFTAVELKQVLQELRMISISHMHADHHLGTVSVIRAWYEEVHNAQPAPLPHTDASMESLFENQSRLAVVGEPAMQSFLSEYAAVEDYGYSRLAPLTLQVAQSKRPAELRWFIDPQQQASLDPKAREELAAQRLVAPSLLGLTDMQAVHVQHCQGARAVSVTWPSGFKVSYSGDCRPSQAFARIGKDSTVCIHEATFDDHLHGDAVAKQHSTLSEALGVAQAMNAKACVLTHFSQRYQKMPVFERSISSNGTNSKKNGEAKTNTPSLSVEDVELDADNAPFDDDSGTLTYADQTGSTEGQSYDIVMNDTAPQAEAQFTTYSPITANAPETVKVKLDSDMKVCMASDYMRVKVGEIAELQYYTPALLKLFAEEAREKIAGGQAVRADEKGGKNGKGKGKGKKA